MLINYEPSEFESPPFTKWSRSSRKSRWLLLNLQHKFRGGKQKLGFICCHTPRSPLQAKVTLKTPPAHKTLSFNKYSAVFLKYLSMADTLFELA